MKNLTTIIFTVTMFAMSYSLFTMEQWEFDNMYHDILNTQTKQSSEMYVVGATRYYSNGRNYKARDTLLMAHTILDAGGYKLLTKEEHALVKTGDVASTINRLNGRVIVNNGEALIKQANKVLDSAVLAYRNGDNKTASNLLLKANRLADTVGTRLLTGTEKSLAEHDLVSDAMDRIIKEGYSN